MKGIDQHPLAPSIFQVDYLTTLAIIYHFFFMGQMSLFCEKLVAGILNNFFFCINLSDCLDKVYQNNEFSYFSTCMLFLALIILLWLQCNVCYFSTVLKIFKGNILKIFTADHLREPQVNYS